MLKWEIVYQAPGITNAATIDIVTRIRDSLETHGTNDMFVNCQIIKDWLQTKYGGTWSVIIGKVGQSASCCTYYDDMYLWIIDNDTTWTFKLFKQSLT